MKNYQNEKIVVVESNTLDILPLKYVKNYLRIDNDCDDEFLLNAIATACNYAENLTGKIIGEKTIQLTFYSGNGIFQIDKDKLNIVTILSVYENDILIDADQYELKNGVINLKKAISGNIKVVFKAGEVIDDTLVDIRQAILYHVASIYNHKDGDFVVPQASMEIYNQYKPVRL